MPGDPLFPTIPDWEVPEETRFVLQDGSTVAAPEGLTAAIDQVIAFFNAKKMDLPDGFFDRKTQFVINGAPFETLLGQSPADPLILMLARGPAGFRFTAKALQHALPSANRPAIDSAGATRRPSVAQARRPGYSDRSSCGCRGHCATAAEPMNTVVSVSPAADPGRQVEVAEAEVDAAALDKIRRGAFATLTGRFQSSRSSYGQETSMHLLLALVLTPPRCPSLG